MRFAGFVASSSSLLVLARSFASLLALVVRLSACLRLRWFAPLAFLSLVFPCPALCVRSPFSWFCVVSCGSLLLVLARVPLRCFLRCLLFVCSLLACCSLRRVPPFFVSPCLPCLLFCVPLLAFSVLVFARLVLRRFSSSCSLCAACPFCPFLAELPFHRLASMVEGL